MTLGAARERFGELKPGETAGALIARADGQLLGSRPG